MNTQFYKIETLTNLHVGSGDANYGIIDNLIQRDPVTNLPTINGSSLKGALREFFEAQWDKNNEKVTQIFGSNDNNAGYRFLSANLLAIPVRSNKKAYFLATAPMVIEQLKKDAESFGQTSDLSVFFDEKGNFKFVPRKETGEQTNKESKVKPIIFSKPEGLLIENFDVFEKKDNSGETILGNFENLIIFSNDDFKKLCNDTNLPVIARNKVGDNLWYEQIVPHKSLFYFTLIHNKKNLDDFNAELNKNIVHIGANATVGYGFTKISEI